MMGFATLCIVLPPLCPCYIIRNKNYQWLPIRYLYPIFDKKPSFIREKFFVNFSQQFCQIFTRYSYVKCLSLHPPHLHALSSPYFSIQKGRIRQMQPFCNDFPGGGPIPLIAAFPYRFAFFFCFFLSLDKFFFGSGSFVLLHL